MEVRCVPIYTVDDDEDDLVQESQSQNIFNV